MNQRSVLYPLLVLVLCSATAGAATIYVGPTRTYTTIAAGWTAAANGDTILIDPGTYTVNDAVASQGVNLGGTKDGVTLCGNGGRPVIDRAGVSGVGVYIRNGCSNITLKNLEITGTSNDAAIQSDAGTTITVKDCVIRDTWRALNVRDTSTANPTLNFVLDGCHIYNGTINNSSFVSVQATTTSLTIKGCWIHNGTPSTNYLVTSQAKASYVLYNRLGDEPGWTGSVGGPIVQFPSFGTTIVMGNIIQNVPTAGQGTMISYGASTVPGGVGTQFYGLYNDMIGRRAGSVTAFNLVNLPVPALLANNMFVNDAGGSTFANGSIVNNSLIINSNMAVTNTNHATPMNWAMYQSDANQNPTPPHAEVGTWFDWNVLDMHLIDPNDPVYYGAGVTYNDGRGGACVPGSILSFPATDPTTGFSLMPVGEFGPLPFNAACTPGVVTRSTNVDRGAYSVSANRAPVVDVGPDQAVSRPDAVLLTGLVVDDALVGSTYSFIWSKVSGPGSVSFVNANAQSTSATFSADGTYVLQLAASDGTLNGSDTLSVVVTSGATNHAPTASITSTLPQYIYEGWPTITMTATASDPDAGQMLTYAWTQTAGQGQTLTGATTLNASFTVGAHTLTSRANELLTFRFVATDNGSPVMSSTPVTASVTCYLCGDIDHDHAVILADLKLLVAAWNTTPASGNWNLAADLDGDHAVILADLKLLVANWNRSLP